VDVDFTGALGDRGRQEKRAAVDERGGKPPDETAYVKRRESGVIDGWTVIGEYFAKCKVGVLGFAYRGVQ
jgi:hypothetical protein